MYDASVDKIRKMRIRINTSNITSTIANIIKFITTITYNAAYISIAGYRSTICCISNMCIA